MSSTYVVPRDLAADFNRWQKPAIAFGIVLLVASTVGAAFNPDEFFRSYLFSYLFWVGLALGSLSIVMTQYLTGGAWGVVTRRTLESATRTLPLLALLFIPVIAGIPHLYGWSHADMVRGDERMQHRSVFMNSGFFIGRAVFYFAVWILFSHLLNKWSRQEDEHGGQRQRLARLSAPGLIVYVFTVTFASVDWAESLSNHWYSTMWGFLFVAGYGLAAMAFVILALALLSRRQPMSEALRPSHFHDLGKLLLMFVMLWAYFQYSQLIVVWSGNLAGEIPWYLPRFATTWRWLSGAVIYIEFLLPFLLLLSRPLKRNQWGLCVVVLILLVMRMVDSFWMVMPAEYPAGIRIHWLNFTVPLGLGGIWLGAFLHQLKKRPLLPLQDPNLEMALHHGEE